MPRQIAASRSAPPSFKTLFTARKAPSRRTGEFCSASSDRSVGIDLVACLGLHPSHGTPLFTFRERRIDSSACQEVMYLTSASDSSNCAPGNWLVTRASDDDYVDEQLGYFELKGQDVTGHRDFSKNNKNGDSK